MHIVWNMVIIASQFVINDERLKLIIYEMQAEQMIFNRE